MLSSKPAAATHWDESIGMEPRKLIPVSPKATHAVFYVRQRMEYLLHERKSAIIAKPAS
jgi:hypothetical protein